MENPIFHCIKDSEELALALACQISAILENAILARGEATLIVSGGSTPKPLFEILSRKKLAWDHVTITLADERCVEPSDEQSNARLVKEHLLVNLAKEANFVSLFDGGAIEQLSTDNTSATLDGLPIYDAVILGMGNDGHTASIFPKASNLAEALDPQQKQSALIVDPVTVTPLRITQTAKRLLNTRFLALHITGEEKTNLLQEILSNPDSTQWPIAYFLNQKLVPVNVYMNIPFEDQYSVHQDTDGETP